MVDFGYAPHRTRHHIDWRRSRPVRTGLQEEFMVSIFLGKRICI
jgi:hypothetical protein